MLIFTPIPVCLNINSCICVTFNSKGKRNCVYACKGNKHKGCRHHVVAVY